MHVKQFLEPEYPATVQHVWQFCRAQPPESSARLSHHQAIITAIRLERLVNLNLGITKWHQGEEDVLCCVPKLNFHHRRGAV